MSDCQGFYTGDSARWYKVCGCNCMAWTIRCPKNGQHDCPCYRYNMQPRHPRAQWQLLQVGRARIKHADNNDYISIKIFADLENFVLQLCLGWKGGSKASPRIRFRKTLFLTGWVACWASTSCLEYFYNVWKLLWKGIHFFKTFLQKLCDMHPVQI